jgi:hypothetical protein
MDHFSQKFKEFLSEIVRDFLQGQFDYQLENKISQMLLNESYLDICRNFDNNQLVEQISVHSQAYVEKIK